MRRHERGVSCVESAGFFEFCRQIRMKDLKPVKGINVGKTMSCMVPVDSGWTVAGIGIRLRAIGRRPPYCGF